MPLLQSSGGGQSSSNPASPAAPAKPIEPVGVKIGEQIIALDPKPMTKADVDAIRQRRSYLSDQLNSVQGRRDALVKELRRSPEGVARVGLEQRLQLLDQRLLRLEQDIDIASKAIAAAPVALAATTEEEKAADRAERGTLSSGQITAISIVGTVAVGMPLAIALGRSLLRRSTMPKPAPQILESAARLERMENAIDSMAIEIERISEGQRFVTQLMAGKAAEAPLLEARVAEPVAELRQRNP